MKRRLISVLLIVVMLCNIQVPMLSVLGDTTNKELYDKYGMSIQTLFEEYPECLNNEAFFNLMVGFGETYKEVLSHYEDQAGVAAFITTLKQGGLTVFGRELLAKIGLTQNTRDKILTETVQALMREAGANKNIIYEISSELEENYSIFDAGYSIANKAAKTKFIQDLKKASKYISDKTAEDMFEYMTESGDKIMEKIDTGVSLSQVILTTFQLQELEFALIDRLLVLLPEEGCLHEGLVLLHKQIDQNIITHINQGILTEGIFNLIEEAIKQGGELLFGKGVVDVANLAIWLFTDIIYQGATAEEIAQTIYFCSCVNEIKELVDNKRFEIWSKHYNNENVTEQDIGDYEILMSLYIVTTRMTLEHAKKMAPNSGLKAQCQNNLDLLNDFMSYDNYIALCLNEAKEKNDSLITEEKVLEKIDKLVKIFNAENGNMYFTSDGNPDRSPYDTSYVNSVISSSWFKKTFSDFGIPSGNDIANVVSNHYYPSNKKNNPEGLPRGTSCHGFGTWAVWYLFASNNSDFVQLEYVISNGEDSTAKLDYKTLSKYAKPGDLIRIQSTKDSGYGHSVIFISCDERGVTVLDCNWNVTCNISKHTIPYTMDSPSMGQWGKCPIAISRASSYSVSIDDSVNIIEIPNGEQWRVDRGSMNLRIRSGASTAYSQVGLVTFQDIVTVTKTQGNWGYITYNGVSGWICLDYCTKIEPTITQRPNNTSIPTVTIAPSNTNTTIPTTTPILTDFGWIKASECPTDANIVDTKWTYTYKETIEDSRPWIEGWTYGGERLETVSSGTFEYATFPNTFDKSSAIYTGMYTSKEAVPVTDGTERRIISDNMTGYIYWHYSYPVSDKSVNNRIIGYYYNQHLKKEVGNWCYVTNFAAFKSPKTYSITANNKAGGGTIYKITDSEYMDYSIAKGSYWWYRFEYYTCNYEDVKTIYQHYRLVNRESVTEVVEGDTISNVVKWVKIEPTITLAPTNTPIPTVTLAPTNTPIPTVTLAPTNTPIPTVTLAPTNTPMPTSTPIPTISDWVKVSECPTGAEIVDIKWTYTDKETIEDSRSWVEGWTYGGERLETVSSGTFEYATFPNTFDKSSAIYTGMYTSKEAVPVTDGTERRIISDNMTGYIYWHYSYPVSDKSVNNRIVGYYYNQHLKKEVGNWCYVTNFAAFKSPKNYTIATNNKAGGGTVYKITDSEYMDYSIAKGSYWWYRFEYYTCNYEDVKTIYQHYRLVDKESVTEVVEGDTISNVVKWIKYR